MKKTLAMLLAIVMLLITVTGCSDDDSKKKDNSSKSNSSVASKDESSAPEEPVDEPEIPSEEDSIEEPEEDPIEEPEEDFDNRSPEQKRADNIKTGKDKEFAKSGLFKEGNLVRLANFLRKGEQGKDVTVVVLGGTNSVNNGYASAGYSFAAALRDWWVNKYTGKLNLVLNGAATMSSVEACLRVDDDVLDHNPDLVLLDFSVQDNFSSMAKTNSVGFDNLVRRILKHKSNPAVITMLLPGAEQESYSMNPTNCNPIATAAKYEKEISAYYDIPVLDIETAFWDTIYGLLEITEKTERPVISWKDVAGDSICLTDAGHAMIFSIIENLFDTTLAKLSKIGTKVPAVKTKGYFGNDSYMNGEMISIADIVEGKANGYKFDLDFKFKDEQYGYYYTNFPDTAGVQKSKIHTYRHYVATDANDKQYEKDPHYLALTLPVSNGNTYLMYESTVTFSSKYLTKPYSDYGPLTVEFYNAEGKPLESAKRGCGNIKDNINCGQYDQIKIPAGAVKLVIKAYSDSGRINFVGIGSY